jgi:hypothetical protein
MDDKDCDCLVDMSVHAHFYLDYASRKLLKLADSSLFSYQFGVRYLTFRFLIKSDLGSVVCKKPTELCRWLHLLF